MIKKLPFVAIALMVLMPVTLFASDTTKIWKDVLADFKSSTLNVKWLNPPSATIFNKVDVMDARVDTNHLGMFTPGTDFFLPNKLIFSNNETLSFVLKNKFTSLQNGDKACLIIVRDFWINEKKSKMIISDKRNATDTRTSKITLKLDIFLNQNELYKPLCRIDTIIWTSKLIAKSTYYLFETALETINSKILLAVEDGGFLQRKSENRQTIVNQYLAYNLLKIPNKETAVKGIYYSFDQFYKNLPVTEQFNVQEYGSNQFLLYIENNKGEHILKHDVWGIFDGENYYIMQSGILFKLYFEGKAVYWMGLKEYNLVPLKIPFRVPLLDNYGLTGSLKLTPDNKIKSTPNLLNINTGNEY